MLKGPNLRKELSEAKFDEMKSRRFEVVRVTERLCEVCSRAINIEEHVLREVYVSDETDYANLLARSRIYDRAEVDLQEGKIYLHDHDYRGEAHPRCLESL